MKCPKTMIRQKLSNFLTDEDGAVTVDFVVLTAGVIALGVVAASQFVVSDDDIDEMDPNYSELDYIAQYMEQ
jgi:Flp pilus assembly pilin Flp